MTTLLVDRQEDGTALITINRPEKRNAMNHAFFHDLPAVLADLDEDPDIHACVITGAGEAFSSGGDIADFDRLTDVPSYRRQVRLALGAFQSLERCETITIAAVNGLAFGGGTELTLACDLALAASDARFAFREVSVGLMPGYGLVRGPETVGRAWTRWLALTGEEIDAGQAQQIGLVHRVVPSERLVEESLALAGRIAANRDGRGPVRKAVPQPRHGEHQRGDRRHRAAVHDRGAQGADPRVPGEPRRAANRS